MSAEKTQRNKMLELLGETLSIKRNFANPLDRYLWEQEKTKHLHLMMDKAELLGLIPERDPIQLSVPKTGRWRSASAAAAKEHFREFNALLEKGQEEEPFNVRRLRALLKRMEDATPEERDDNLVQDVHCYALAVYSYKLEETGEVRTALLFLQDILMSGPYSVRETNPDGVKELVETFLFRLAFLDRQKAHKEKTQ